MGGGYLDLKEDWNEFKSILEEHGITKLYHFTDEQNISSIKENGGLYSWFHCEQNGITIKCPGGNESSRINDKDKGLEDFVRLSFNPRPPMYYVVQDRIPNPIILEVDTSVIYWKSTKFSDENATHSEAFIGDELDDFKAIQFKLAMKGYKSWAHTDMQKRYIQAEVMVNQHIPIEYIINL